MSRVRHASKFAAGLFAFALVLVIPSVGATASDSHLVEYSFTGNFVSEADPGSDPFWEQFEDGTFEATYFLPPGSLPAASGSSLSLATFDFVLRAPDGSELMRYSSPGDFGALFADFFGPGSGDGFVFNNGTTQFQLGFRSGFTGTGTSVDGAVFDVAPDGPPGEINVLNASAQVVCTIVGTPGDDFLIGTDSDDVICGRGGDDTIYGRRGNDVLRGGSGDDVIYGGFGFDELRGNDGNDRLVGGAQPDVIHGGEGDDVLRGKGGADWLEGNRGDDSLYGALGDDSLLGGVGTDLCRGGLGVNDIQSCEN